MIVRKSLLSQLTWLHNGCNDLSEVALINLEKFKLVVFYTNPPLFGILLFLGIFHMYEYGSGIFGVFF